MSDQILMFNSPDNVSDEELSALRTRIFICRNAPITVASGLAGGYFLLNQFWIKRAFNVPFALGLGVCGYFLTYSHFSSSYMNMKSTFTKGSDFTSNRVQKKSHFISSGSDVMQVIHKRWIRYALSNNYFVDQKYEHGRGEIHLEKPNRPY
ncbi:unnamed protein product [Moneuplotes crassus]|uniref:Uncharacterized protein n=1 Tax=Euplotes crassus TaxID=5936 RepID=A0AAD2D838_EUPCR|nr:unnamed protein product [Moneuplotes crassus]